ncbi:MAG: SapC family protein [Pseudomonadota bacterium]
MSETANAPQLSGQMFLFNRPELINKEQHGSLGVTQPSKRFDFCANVRAIPLTVSEIPQAMKDYPVVFASKEQMVPIAVVGLVDDVNLFVDEEGNWEHNRYVPGYVRRYPFGVASETGGDRMAVVVDRGYSGLQENGEIPLFENGEPSQMTEQAIEFCKNYEQDRHRTNEFAKLISEMDIVKGQSAQFTPNGESEPKTFAEYFGIEEQAIKDLSDEKFLQARQSGVLPIVYAMLMSMGNWRPLMQRRAIRYNMSDKDVLNPVLN